MTAAGLALFAGVLLAAAATPGPATMTVLARTLAHGTRGAFAFCVGIILGDVVWLATAAVGLAAIAEQTALVLRAISYAGAVYMLVLARAFWTSRVTPPTAAPRVTGWGMAQGLLLQLGNPKVALFYVALLPMLVPIDRLTASDFVLLAIVAAAVIAIVNAIYIGFAIVVRQHVRSPRTLKVLHRISAVMLALAAVVLAWSA